MKYPCKRQVSSVGDFAGGEGEEIDSWRVGWRPVGGRKWAWKEEEESLCREGKENNVGEGVVDCPRTVKRPEMPISWGSRVLGEVWERMPISVRIVGERRDADRDWGE